MRLAEIIFYENEILIEDALFEMARIKPADSGLPWIIFISSKDYTKQQYWARIKISNIKGAFSPNDNFLVSISKQPKILAGNAKMKQDELNDIFDWVILNYETLIKYWNEQYDSDSDMYKELKRL